MTSAIRKENPGGFAAVSLTCCGVVVAEQHHRDAERNPFTPDDVRRIDSASYRGKAECGNASHGKEAAAFFE